MRPLPPLNGIRAFEAAARLGSLMAAGQELHVSATAVSRLVRLLEHRLGVDLFLRSANRLELTSAGRLYQQGLTPLLDSLSRLTEEVRGSGGPPVLTVGIGPTFAMRWMIPRLGRFQVVAPEVEVRFATGGAAAPFRRDWTCGIKLGDGAPEGLEADVLFAAQLTPVCSPAVAAGLDLARVPLLRVAHAPRDWPDWLARAGRSDIVQRGPVFENYGQALQAASDGVGLAMGITPYIDDDLQAGRLVAPFDLSIPKGASWHLIYAPERRREAPFNAFRDWLQSEVSSGSRR